MKNIYNPYHSTAKNLKSNFIYVIHKKEQMLKDSYLGFLTHSPVIKQLVNKLDFEALSVRIEKAKDLWHLLQDDEGEKGRKTNRTTGGSVSIRRLALGLAAGGFSLEAINFVSQTLHDPIFFSWLQGTSLKSLVAFPEMITFTHSP